MSVLHRQLLPTRLARHRIDPWMLSPGPREVVTVAWSGGQPADYRDDEFELVDDYDPELGLLDDLDAWDED